MDAPTAIAPASAAPRLTGTRRWVALALLLGLAGPGWMAWTAPPYANWDERFSMENVEWVLRSGRLLPRAYYWYAPPAFLPQAWMLAASSRAARATGWRALETWTDEPKFRFTAWGTRLSRLPGVLYGGVAVGALAALALRLAGPWLAAIAPLVLVSSPWFHAGVYGFKPDALLLALSVLCLAQLAVYLDRGRAGDFWLAALLFGAATAAKLNGALVAVPLALAALREPSWPVRARRIALAGLCGIAVYLLLVPWPFPLQALHYLNRLDSQYDNHAEAEGPLDLVGMLLSRLGAPHFFGRWIAVAALAGAILVLWRAVRRQGAGQRILGWCVVAAHGVTNLAFLGATTLYPKENHLLPVMPVVALLAALPVAAALQGLERRRLRGLALLLVAALAAFATVRSASFAVARQAPLAAKQLGRSILRRLDARPGRVVAWFHDSEDAIQFGKIRRGLPPAIVPLARSTLADPAFLAAFDCIAGSGPLPEALDAESVRRFQARALNRLRWPARLLPGRAAPHWFGCAPWQRKGSVVLVAEPVSARTLRAEVPTDLPPHRAVSVEITSRESSDVASLRLDGRPHSLYFGGRLARGRATLQVTVRGAPSPRTVELDLRPGAGEPTRVALRLWEPPAAVPGRPPAR